MDLHLDHYLDELSKENLHKNYRIFQIRHSMGV